MAAQASKRAGGCLCGAVRFSAALSTHAVGACHCDQCRRWTGSALLSVPVDLDAITWTGEKHIATCQSSEWAMRGFCATCGSGLYYRVTKGPEAVKIWVPLGLFDDPEGLTLESEIYIDCKPAAFAYAGVGRHLMTRQECISRFAPAVNGDHHDQV